jgi:hypothetical protein
MPASSHRPSSRTLALAAIVIATSVACQARAGAAAPGTVAPAAAPVGQAPAVTALVADAQAARARHDTRMLHAIRTRLAARIGDTAVVQAEATVAQAVANLAAAEAAHDAMARARALARLRELCDPASLTSAFAPCSAGPTD